MADGRRRILPAARKEGLVVKELPDEVLVYDLDSHKAHCLNGAAAVIWKHFDGKASVAEVASRAAAEGGYPLDSEVVLLALQQLRKAKLMVADGEAPQTEGHLSRRDLIKKLGLAATTLPLVTSILAPTAYANVSCGGPCTADAVCQTQSGFCYCVSSFCGVPP